MILRIIKYLLPLVSILFIFLDANATNCVSSVNAYQEGKNIVITYQLSKRSDIKVSISIDGGRNYSTLKKVIGDVGKDIKKGDKNITWRVLEEFEKFDYDNVCFKVEEYFTENGHEYVDLGLPSGTLWATCNVGAKSPEDYGDYFAWGETITKSTYDWSNNKWFKNFSTLTKYCTSSSNGTVDNKTTLDLSDDAAYVNWGSSWRMPTKAEYDELRNTNYTTWTWTTQNGVKGYKVTSKTNGSSIFLPAAGYRFDLSFAEKAGSYGFYWSSSLDSSYPHFASYLVFSLGGVDCVNSLRYGGQSVRPVLR